MIAAVEVGISCLAAVDKTHLILINIEEEKEEEEEEEGKEAQMNER